MSEKSGVGSIAMFNGNGVNGNVLPRWLFDMVYFGLSLTKGDFSFTKKGSNGVPSIKYI